jgi:hypothetical protein
MNQMKKIILVIAFCFSFSLIQSQVVGTPRLLRKANFTLTPEEEFDNFTNKFNLITTSWLMTSGASEPVVATSGRVGFGITNCFSDWASDAFDIAGWIFINSTSLTDNSSSKLLPYTTAASSTGGTVQTSALLGGQKYFTNFATSRKLFAFFTQANNITSVKFVSDSGIDSACTDAITGSLVSTNGKYRCYYQSANRGDTTADAFFIHMFFIPIAQSSAVTFTQSRADFGVAIGDQSPVADDYAARVSWTTAGQVTKVYGLMAVKGASATTPGLAPTNANLQELADAFAAILP